VSKRKRCTVAYATAERQYLWTVDLPGEATIGDALAATRVECGDIDAPWDSAPVGIFGERRDRTDLPADGDRIELYRPLRDDPRARRRERVRSSRKLTGR